MRVSRQRRLRGEHQWSRPQWSPHGGRLPPRHAPRSPHPLRQAAPRGPGVLRQPQSQLPTQTSAHVQAATVQSLNSLDLLLTKSVFSLEFSLMCTKNTAAVRILSLDIC